MPIPFKKAACPYCYQRIDPTKPDYRCSGRPAPGKPACPKTEDARRLQNLGSADPVYPSFAPERSLLRRTGATCPRCGGLTGTRVCPACHSVLPANFTADSPLFGLVGVRGSGKTVLLTVLTKELKTTVARRFAASIAPVGTSQLLTALERSRDSMDDRGGSLPAQTRRFTRQDTTPAVFEWQLTRHVLGVERPASMIFSFYDSSGEDLNDDERTRDLHYLAATDGLILLLDPFGFPANRDDAVRRGVDAESLRNAPETVLGNVTAMLREAERLAPNTKIKRPLAVVLAKIDAFYDRFGPNHPIRRPASLEPLFAEREAQELHTSIESVVSQWGGDAVLEMLRHNYATYRFFVVSALGAEPDYRTGQVNGKGVLPHRVAEPLLWLMADRGFIGKAG